MHALLVPANKMLPGISGANSATNLVSTSAETVAVLTA